MKLVFVLLATLPAVSYAIFSKGAKNSGAMAMIRPLLPPECNKEVDDVMKEGDKIYDWLYNEKCKECPNGVKFSALILKEELAKMCIDAYIDWLAQQGLDIDKICTKKFRRKELWPLYNQLRAECIMKYDEVKNHPDFCKAKDGDFPKTSKCIQDRATKLLKKVTTPIPPMDCLQKGLSKCTSKFLGKAKTHFLKKMRDSCEIHKGKNLWCIGMKFFETKCTGKF